MEVFSRISREDLKLIVVDLNIKLLISLSVIQVTKVKLIAKVAVIINTKIIFLKEKILIVIEITKISTIVYKIQI